MRHETTLGDAKVAALDHRHGARMDTLLPVTFTILGLEGETLGRGDATLSDLSQDGARLTCLRLSDGRYPLEPHFVLVSPKSRDLSDLWIKVRPRYIQFADGRAEMGVSIIKASKGFERLFDIAPLLD